MRRADHASTRTPEPCEASEIDGVVPASKGGAEGLRGPRASQRKALSFGAFRGIDREGNWTWEA